MPKPWYSIKAAANERNVYRTGPASSTGECVR
jgi:hypothetical protein